MLEVTNQTLEAMKASEQSYDSDISQPAIATSSLIPRPLPLCVCVHTITLKGNRFPFLYNRRGMQTEE